MGKSAPSPPPAPDPVALANAQAQANIQSAQEQQKLNMVGSSGPQGSVSYHADSNEPGGYTQVTTLSPEQQALYNSLTSAQQGALDIGNQQLGRVSNALSTPLDTSGLPNLSAGNYSGVPQLQSQIQGLTNGVSGGQIQNSFNGGQPLLYGFNPGQQVQGQVGPQDLGGAANAVSNAVYQQAASRLDPQYSLAQQQLETKLANQGLNANDLAYQNAMDTFNRGKNDAYNQAIYSAIPAGLNAENTLFGQSLQQGQFANSAAAQQYQQNQGLAAFHNQTAGQDFGQNQQQAQFANQAQAQAYQQALANAQMQNANAMAQAQFGNSANLQGFNEANAAATLANQARNQGLQERAYQENQPINQLSGLLSLGQVMMPQGIQYTPSQVAPTDVLGAQALSTQAQMNAYNAQLQQNSGLMNGLFSLGSAAIMASDRRLKRDVELLYRRKDGVGVYRFRYLNDNTSRVGVMAQELRKVRPDLVVRRPDGLLAVAYSGLEAA